jgi:hypothetical protein
MPDYNLAGLSTRSFEQMIQALACKIIGPGIVIFGDGPDGGREATSTGCLSNFPSPTDCWDGYLVVQAKFCQRPKGKPGEDARWAAEQLKKELDAFAVAKTKRRKPQYYIFATNVILTPVPRAGGKDSIAALINQYKKRIGLKDYRIWDYDQICRFLEANQSVRHTYEAWITPGDVLAKIISKLDVTSPDFGKVMVNFLQKEILDDHFSKLEQAGHSPENRIPLEKVFIDLPAFNERCSKPPDEEPPPKGLPPGFLVEMLEAGSLCLRPEEPDGIVQRPGTESPTVWAERGRYVLVGGPGQGKSTLTQFLCQIQRASLLEGRRGLDSDVKQAVKSILDNCTFQQLSWRTAKRFPIRVEFARFAKTLASQAETKVTSILSYAAFLIRERSDYEISVEDLRRWLQKYPWLVILDGLDEVPASSNRTQVLTAVRDFLVDISTSNSDVLILATTRPQGYNEEFAPQRYQHRWLAPLSVSRAFHYGQNLVELTYAQNFQRKKEVMSRLKSAIEIPSTVRLMESPLQVTIMARLLAQVAQPPQERYRLFQQYYEVIYRREMERGVEKLSRLLRDQEANVHSIHHRTGLLLQMESERTRHTDATISIQDFKAVVSDRLREEGYTGDALVELTDSIATCATDRLVFLVPSQSDRVGFEIRSLQEFMAAEALMDGPDNVVIERLRMIAPVPFWQNVLLFAAGKCFAERQWLRDSIAWVCGELNDDPADNLAHLTIAGSRVAVSLLEDGPARQQPAYAQALARRALSLLSLPSEEIHDRLADVYEPEFERVYREELASQLGRGSISDRIASWRLICKILSNRGAPWVEETAESQWPESIGDRIELFENLDVSRGNRWLLDKYSQSFFEVPMFFRRYLRERKEVDQIFPSNKLAAQALSFWPLRIMRLRRGTRLHHEESPYVSFKIRDLGDLECQLVLLDKSRELLCDFVSLKNVHTYWKPLVEGASFAKKPSKDSLAHTLRSIGTSLEVKALSGVYRFPLPWPLLACLSSVEKAEDLLTLAERAERGCMGNLTDWLEAERRWKLKGIISEDISRMNDDHWPIPQDIRAVGFPFACLEGIWVVIGTLHVAEWKSLWTKLPGEKAKSAFAPLIIYSVFEPYSLLGPPKSRERAASTLPLVDIVTKIRRPFPVYADSLCSLYKVLKGAGKAGYVLNHLGNIMGGFYGNVSQVGLETRKVLSELTADLCDLLEHEPGFTGVLNLLSAIASSLSIDRVPELVWQICDETESPVFNSALVLQLAQERLDGGVFANIAEKLLSKCGKDEAWVLSALGVFENHQMNNKEGIVFLEKMLAEFPPYLYAARRKVVALLLDLLGRRVASICEGTVWKKLCLPNGLPKLLSE